MEPFTGISQQIYKMRNQAFRILYDTLLESVGLGDEEMYAMLCLNLRRVANSKFAALTIIDIRTHLPLASYGAYDDNLMPTCKPLRLKSDEPFKIEMINKCKMAQVRKCVHDAVCLLHYYDEEINEHTEGKGECVGVSCIQQGNLYAIGLVKMPEGLPLKMSDMLDNYLNLASVLLSRNQALRETEKTGREMRNILSSIKNILIFIDGADRVLLWNQTAEKILGASENDVRLQLLADVAVPWEWEKIEAGLMRMKRAAQPVEVPDVRIGPSGAMGLHMTFRCYPCADEHGGCVLVGEEVKDKETNKEPGWMHEKMLKELLNGLVENITCCQAEVDGHMRMLETQTSQLKLNHPNNEKNLTERYLAMESEVLHIKSVVNRGRKMIEAVGQMIRQENAPVIDVNLNAALESAVDLTAFEWQRVARLERNMRSDLPMYPCRAGEMNTIFVSLILNAAQAIAAKTSPESRMGIITLETERTSAGIMIRVVDDGEGVGKEIGNEIFKPFFTSRSGCGSIGQGLFVSRLLVRKYGGDILWKKHPVAGTIFEVFLPFKASVDSSGTRR